MLLFILFSFQRPYVANLLPCIVKIAKRMDDSVQEVLGTMMLKLCPVLGNFMNEHDVKVSSLPKQGVQGNLKFSFYSQNSFLSLAHLHIIYSEKLKIDAAVQY